MAFTFDPDFTLEQLRTVRCAFIDSSSIIYAEKAGTLEILCGELQLQTVPGVVREVGIPIPDISVAPEIDSSISVDDQLLASAAEAHLAVISEDRKLLMKADDRGLAGYNMLVMLELLLLRGHISLAEWDRARKRLLAAAQYSSRVVHAGQQLHWAVRKEVG